MLIDISTHPVHPTHDDLAPVDNLLTFPRQRFGPVQIARWFLRLGSLLWNDQVDITPTAFLLVLINDEDVRVYRGGDRALFHDAVLAVQHHDNHVQMPDSYDGPQEARDKLKVQRRQEAIDAELRHQKNGRR